VGDGQRPPRRRSGPGGPRGGHPTINPFINPEYVKDEYNAGHPADDTAKYLEPWSKLLEGNGYEPVAAAGGRVAWICGMTDSGVNPINHSSV
jgi:hypothetical protein